MKIINYSIFIMLFYFSSNNSFSQNNNHFTCNGLVIDSIYLKKIPFTTIQKKADLTNLKVITICDSSGIYSFTHTSESIFVIISSVGYKNKIANLSCKFTDTVKLAPLNSILEGISVIGQREKFEDSGDKITFNVKQDQFANGLTAIEILRKTPMVTVDQNGNVFVRGSKVEILLNDKSISSIGVSEFLKQLPSETIEKIEVITAPSAKYDSQGGAGIINIITNNEKIKKSNDLLITGSLGNISSNFSTNLSYKFKKITINLGVSKNWYHNLADGETKIKERDTPIFFQNFTGEFIGSFTNLNTSTIFNINDNNSLTIDVLGSSQMLKTYLPTNSKFFLNDSLFHRDVNSNNISHFVVSSIEHLFKIKNTKSEFKTRFVYIKNQNTSNTDYEQRIITTNNSNNSVFFLNSNPNENNEFSLQSDFTNKKKGITNVGVKMINRTMLSVFDTYINNSNIIHTQAYSGNLKFHQEIYSAYFSQNSKFTPKISIQSGIRIEFTKNNLNSSTLSQDFNSTYFNMFPTISIAYNLKSTKKISTSFTQRIQRPSIFYLNPNSQQGDPSATLQGNPQLSPELISNLDLSYGEYLNDSYLKITGYYRYTKNPITKLNSFNTSLVNSTYMNGTSENIYGANIWCDIKPSKKIDVNINFDLSYQKIYLETPNLNLTNNSIFSSISTTSSFNFGKGWYCQIYANYVSPKLTIQGKESSISFSAVSLKKELLKKKASLALNLDNPYTKYFSWNIESNISDISYQDNTKLFNRGLRIIFNYKIGGNQVNKIPKNNQEDLKAAELK